MTFVTRENRHFVAAQAVVFVTTIVLFFDKCLEDIRKLYNVKRISISKYLNSIYSSYYNKSLIDYLSIFKNMKIINSNDNIVEILEKNYLIYPHFIKNEDDYYYL